MNVTESIRQTNISYGGGIVPQANALSSSKAIQLAQGATIYTPINERLSRIPFTFNFTGSVGLMGVENVFIKIKLNIQDTGNESLVINGYQDAVITEGTFGTVNYYEEAITDYSRDLITVNTYLPALVTNELLKFNYPTVSVVLRNLKTGNKYVDRALSVRLYRRNREEHPYDAMFAGLDDEFYIGIHARETFRIPYNVSCTIGEIYTDERQLNYDQKMLLAFPS